MRGITKLFGQAGRRGLFGLTALLVLASPLIFAAPVFADVFTVSGQITASDTGDPLAGVVLEVRDGNNSLVATTESDSSGNYNLNLAEGTYDIGVDSNTPGYGSTSFEDYVVSANTILDIVLLRIPETINLEGQVKAASSQGWQVPKAAVELLEPGTTNVIASTTTGIMFGEYDFFLDNPGGIYDVRVTPPPNWLYQQTTEHNVDLTADTTLHFALEPIPIPSNANLLGQVTDVGVPTEDIRVDIFEPGSHTNLVATTSTNSEGNYGLVLPEGNYDVKVNKGGQIKQALNVFIPADPPTVINFNYEPPAVFYRIGGAVKGESTSGVSLTGARVEALEAGTTNVIASSTVSVMSRRYSLLVPGGIYDIRVTPAANWGYQSKTISGQTIEADTTLDVTLQGAIPAEADLSGTVKTSDTQQPVHAATVRVFQPGSNSLVAVTSTNSTGDYGFALPAGSYDVEVTPPSDMTSAYLTNRLNNTSIQPGTTLNFELQVRPPITHVKLSGYVRGNTGGVPLPRVAVTLYEPGTNSVVSTTVSSIFAAGSYSFIVDPGVYDIRAVPPPGMAYLPGFWSSVSITSNRTLDLLLEQFPPETTPPEISYELSSQPNAAGWFTSPVTLTWTVTDPESAITEQSGCETVTHQTDVTEMTYTCSATSSGGSASESVILKYDATAPVLDPPEWSANPLTAGTDTTLTVPVNDPTSGVAEGEYFVGGSDPGEGNGTAMDLDSGELSATFGTDMLPGTYIVSIRARDNAGNWSQVTTTELIVQDVTPPVVDYVLSAQPNANGWYSSDVTIDWQATDPEPSSGTPTDPPNTVAATEGQNVTYTSQPSCDPAGNCATGSVQLSIDKTNPTISTPTMSGIISLPLLGNILLGNTTNISATVGDNLSGVVRAEYYFDTDPGQGSGTTMTLAGTPTSGTATATANVSGLGSGQHTLYVRSQDASGRWSTAATYAFRRL